MARMSTRKSEGCIYNKICIDPKTGKRFTRAIDCPEVKTGKNDCEHCGWNPKVEEERKEKIMHGGK